MPTDAYQAARLKQGAQRNQISNAKFMQNSAVASQRLAIELQRLGMSKDKAIREADTHKQSMIQGRIDMLQDVRSLLGQGTEDGHRKAQLILGFMRELDTMSDPAMRAKSSKEVKRLDKELARLGVRIGPKGEMIELTERYPGSIGSQRAAILNNPRSAIQLFTTNPMDWQIGPEKLIAKPGEAFSDVVFNDLLGEASNHTVSLSSSDSEIMEVLHGAGLSTTGNNPAIALSYVQQARAVGERRQQDINALTSQRDTHASLVTNPDDYWGRFNVATQMANEATGQSGQYNSAADLQKDLESLEALNSVIGPAAEQAGVSPQELIDGVASGQYQSSSFGYLSDEIDYFAKAQVALATDPVFARWAADNGIRIGEGESVGGRHVMRYARAIKKGRTQRLRGTGQMYKVQIERPEKYDLGFGSGGGADLYATRNGDYLDAAEFRLAQEADLEGAPIVSAILSDNDRLGEVKSLISAALPEASRESILLAMDAALSEEFTKDGRAVIDTENGRFLLVNRNGKVILAEDLDKSNLPVLRSRSGERSVFSVAGTGEGMKTGKGSNVLTTLEGLNIGDTMENGVGVYLPKGLELTGQTPIESVYGELAETVAGQPSDQHILLLGGGERETFTSGQIKGKPELLSDEQVVGAMGGLTAEDSTFKALEQMKRRRNKRERHLSRSARHKKDAGLGKVEAGTADPLTEPGEKMIVEPPAEPVVTETVADKPITAADDKSAPRAGQSRWAPIGGETSAGPMLMRVGAKGQPTTDWSFKGDMSPQAANWLTNISPLGNVMVDEQGNISNPPDSSVTEKDDAVKSKMGMPLGTLKDPRSGIAGRQY